MASPAPATQTITRDQLGAGGAAELALDVRAVRLHRAHAEEELRADLGVRVPERDQAQDVELT